MTDLQTGERILMTSCYWECCNCISWGGSQHTRDVVWHTHTLPYL